MPISHFAAGARECERLDKRFHTRTSVRRVLGISDRLRDFRGAASSRGHPWSSMDSRKARNSARRLLGGAIPNTNHRRRRSTPSLPLVAAREKQTALEGRRVSGRLLPSSAAGFPEYE